MILPPGKPIKRHEEVLSSQPTMFPPKRFDNFPPCLGDAQKIYVDAFRFLSLFARFTSNYVVSTSMGPEPAMDYVRRAVWGMLYADDACIVSRSPQGLAKMVEVIVEVCRAFGLTVSAKKTETMCMPLPRTPRTMVRIEAAGQIYKQVQSFTYLGGAVTETPDMSVEIARRTSAC